MEAHSAVAPLVGAGFMVGAPLVVPLEEDPLEAEDLEHLLVGLGLKDS